MGEAALRLEGVDLALDRGSFTVVLGTNGSGKSSLLNAIAGSVALTGGRVYLDGDDVTGWSEQRRARRISRVFQNPFTGTASDLSVAENLVLAGGRAGRRDTSIGLLSGGQRQALTLLMATMVRPSLLLLDEHTAALDPRSAEQVIRLTQAAVARGTLTTLMVTHSLGQAVALGDRILVMHRGRVVHDLRDVRRRRLTEGDLLQLFDRLRWADRLDTAAAEMLRRAYI